MIRVAVAGVSGRMGQMLVKAVQAASDMELAGALDRVGSEWVGRDASPDGRSGVVVSDALGKGLASAQVLIDFTRPEATLDHARWCAANGVKLVIGTTGFDDAGRAAIAEAARRTAIVLSPNMSIGVNVMLELVDQATRALASECDIEIIEAHHRHKVDAPSGTALRIGEVIAQAQGRELKDIAVYAREGHTGERKPGSVGFAVIRGGDIIGDHTVLYAGAGERIEITHKSNTRENYAQGSLRACRFLASHQTGLFNMRDVLGFSGDRSGN